MSEDSQKPKKNDFNGEEQFPDPELELTLSGIMQPSWFGQVVNSGLNIISSIIHSKSSDRLKQDYRASESEAKIGEDRHRELGNRHKKPTNTPSHQTFDFTNVRNAVADFKTEKEQPTGNRVRGNRPPPLVFRQVQSKSTINFKIVALFVFAIFIVGSCKILDNNYNFRRTLERLKNGDQSIYKKKSEKIRDQN